MFFFKKKWLAFSIVSRNITIIEGKNTLIHRYIMKINDDKIYIDHINGNKIDNRKINLRKTNSKQNAMNKSSSKNSSSKYIGVIKRNEKYEAFININYKNIYIGIFDNEIDAAIERDKATLKYFGKYGKMNII